MATKAQNQFAKFVASSPLSSIPHDPVLDLASNCVRDSLGGPTVQLVFDGLAARGESTLTQLMSYIEEKCYATSQKQSQERIEIIRLAKMRVTSSQGECPSRPMIRAALLVLIQHSIVAVKKADVNVNLSTKNSKKKRRRARKTVYTYSVDVDRARVLPRYPRFIEFVKKAIGEMPAIILEEVLLLGRAPTMHIIIKTLDHVYQHQQLEQEIAEEAINGHDSTSSAPIAPMTNSFSSYSDRNVCRKKVLESFKNLAHSGFLEQVKEIQWKTQTDDDEGEYLFEGDNEKLEPASKKQKQSQSFDKYQLEIPAEDNGDDPEAFAVTALLQEEPFASSLPRDTVWSVNIPMLHEQLRALNLGWLAMERFGDKLVGVGSIVTAGLKLVANRRHTTKPGSRCMDFDSLNNFTVGEILPYIPKAMLQRFDNTEGGAEKGVFNTLVQLSKMRNPRVIEVTEVAPGQPANTRFQSRPQQMLSYLRQRIVHQIILDSHGEVAARICSILAQKGYLESDMLAEHAMVPAKDTREILHRLYRDNYIELFNINLGKQHNPASMIYLWGFSSQKCHRKISDNVCTASYNIRLRRQHEVEVGKDFIERAKDAGASDENENEADKKEYTEFCRGLERLDNALIMLDETLMVLKDF